MAAQLLLFGVPGAAIPVRPVCMATRVPADNCSKCSGTGEFEPTRGTCYPCRGTGLNI